MHPVDYNHLKSVAEHEGLDPESRASEIAKILGLPAEIEDLLADAFETTFDSGGREGFEQGFAEGKLEGKS